MFYHSMYCAVERNLKNLLGGLGWRGWTVCVARGALAKRAGVASRQKEVKIKKNKHNQKAKRGPQQSGCFLLPATFHSLLT